MMIMGFLGLVVVTFIVALVAVTLLEKRFSDELKQTWIELEGQASVPAATAAAGTGLPPMPSVKGKLFGGIGLFWLIVMTIFAGGFAVLKMDYDKKERELDRLRYEEWTVRVPVKLEDGATIDNSDARVTLRPPDARFATVESVPGQKVVTVSRLAVRSPAKENLPTLVLSYPGHYDEEVPLDARQISRPHEYIDSMRTIVLNEPVSLEPKPADATTKGYTGDASGIEVIP